MFKNNDIENNLFGFCDLLDDFKSEAYQKAQKQWVEFVNLKENDSVILSFLTESDSYGWFCYWDKNLDDCKGSLFEVTAIKDGWIELDWIYEVPFFVLEKVCNKND